MSMILMFLLPRAKVLHAVDVQLRKVLLNLVCRRLRQPLSDQFDLDFVGVLFGDVFKIGSSRDFTRSLADGSTHADARGPHHDRAVWQDGYCHDGPLVRLGQRRWRRRCLIGARPPAHVTQLLLLHRP